MKRWHVYEVEESSYQGKNVNVRISHAGSTTAPTESRAISNVRYRLGIRSEDLECYGRGGYHRKTTFFGSEYILSPLVIREEEERRAERIG